MREKLFTLIKRLGEFTLFDLVILTEIEESIVRAYLKEFLKCEIIRTKCCNRYVFLKLPDIRIETPVVKVKISEVLNTYIEKCSKISKPSTTRGHKTMTKNHILPFFKDKMICDLSPMDIVEFVEYVQGKGYTHRTVENIFFVLKRAILDYDKNFKFPEIHKLKNPPSLEILSEGEIKQILKAVKFKTWLYPIVLMVVTTGVSLNEVLGIHWDDIDYKNKRIKISKSVHGDSMLWTKPPHKIRYVNMPDILARVLSEWQKVAPPNRHNAVFTNMAGNYHVSSNLRGREIKRVLQHARLKETTFKILQDSYAVMMIKKNMPLTFIRHQLGHAGIQGVADRYREFLNPVPEFNFEL